MKVKFDAKLVNQIMSEERGAALRLLFLIKANHEQKQKGMQKTLTQSRMEETKMLEKTLLNSGLKSTITSKKLQPVENKLLKFEYFKQT